MFTALPAGCPPRHLAVLERTTARQREDTGPALSGLVWPGPIISSLLGRNYQSESDDFLNLLSKAKDQID